MDTSHLHSDWALWGKKLQLHFPQVQIPDIFPHGALWENLMQRLAKAHDLTLAEVAEIIEDMSLTTSLPRKQFEAA